MAGTPNSFTDPTYASLDAKVSQKLGLPDGLLANIRTKGERSNADQVSDAGAKSVYQIIPATRDAVLKRYGIDAYLSPENAAEAAGLLLKESLDRNKGDIALAAAEYHGGTDRANWGPRTKAYVARVAGADSGVAAPAQPAAAPVAQGQSTFDKVMAQMTKPAESQMSTVLQAYQSGQMSPEDAATFEKEVNAGRIMLPSGAALKTATPATGAPAMPNALAKAYLEGKMSPEDRSQLEQLIASGQVAAPKGASQIPGPNGEVTAPPVPAADPTLGERVVGAGEAGLNLLTGATTGAAGMVRGAAGGMIQAARDGTFGTPEGVQLAEQSAMQGAEGLTYQPRTAQGQAQAAAAGEALAQTIPVAALTGEAAALQRAAALARPGNTSLASAARSAAAPAVQTVADVAAPVTAAVAPAVQRVAEVAKGVPGRVAQVFGREAAAEPAPTPGTMGSMGAAGTDVATMRRAAAQELPVPIELTRGQAERSFEQQRFEKETAKDPSLGKPLRERFSDQNQSILRNFDAWADMTGAEAPDLKAVGVAVDRALVEKAKRDKTQIRVAYKEAEKAGEMASPVPTSAITELLDQSRSAEATAPILVAARAELKRLGGAAEGADGALVPAEMSLQNMEQLRKFVNKVAGADPTNIKFASDIKRAIDATTEGAGGDKYRAARRLRENYANQYENRGVIAKMLETKRGTNDRQVAFEDMFDHSILRGSLDDVRTVRKVLQTAGDDGKQAWRELQGQTVNYIRDQATRSVALDERGNRIVSPAGLDKVIRQLDSDRKLDFIFGKKGAEQMRAINDLAKYVYTAPPGAVNTSNTASVLLAALDMGISGASGMPLPVTSGLRLVVNNIKDRRIQRRILDALGPTVKPAKQTPAPVKPARTTYH